MTLAKIRTEIERAKSAVASGGDVGFWVRRLELPAKESEEAARILRQAQRDISSVLGAAKEVSHG